MGVFTLMGSMFPVPPPRDSEGQSLKPSPPPPKMEGSWPKARPLPLSIIEPGTSVLIGDDIPAVVMGVLIRANKSVTYECSWWNGRTREEKWLAECEVEMADGREYSAIGFAARG